MSDETTLTIEQQRRASAVAVAANALRRSRGFANSEPGNAEDIERIANFILTTPEGEIKDGYEFEEGVKDNPNECNETETKWIDDDDPDRMPFGKPLMRVEVGPHFQIPDVHFTRADLAKIATVLGLDNRNISRMVLEPNYLHVTFVNTVGHLRPVTEVTITYLRDSE